MIYVVTAKNKSWEKSGTDREDSFYITELCSGINWRVKAHLENYVMTEVRKG